MSELLPVDVSPIGAFDGRCELVLTGEAPVQRALRTLAPEVLPAWLALGAAGGYATSDAPRCTAASPIESFADGGVLMLDVRDLSPRAFQVLRSALLAQLARRVLDRTGPSELEDDLRADALARAVGDARLEIRLCPQQDEALVRLPGADTAGGDAEFELYPAPRAEIALHLAPQPGKVRRCVVRFAETVDSVLLDALRPRVASWAAMLEAGGFEQPTSAPGLRSSEFGTLQVFDATSAEIVVDHFVAAEGAWSVLANVLARFGAEHPVIDVEVH